MGSYKFIKQFPKDEPVVSMIEFNKTILLATTKRVYKLLDDQFIPLNIVEYKEKENDR